MVCVSRGSAENLPEVCAQVKEITLRPLGIGEIIDRALTLYMRNFVLFNATVAVVVFVPLAIGEYLLYVDQGALMRDYITILQHPGKPPPTALQVFPWSIGSMLAGVPLLLIAGLLGLFANNAVAISIGAMYAGRTPTLGPSLRTTFARWLSIIALFFLYLLVAVGIYVGLMAIVFGVVFGLSMLAVALRGAALAGAAAVFAIAFALVPLAMLVAVALFIMLAIAFAFAGYAVVIERMGATSAISSALGRIFNRREIGKALVVGLVAILIGMGISYLSFFGQLLLGFLPGGHVLVTLWVTVFYVLGAAVQTSFYAVYYYDVRIRREGFDLETELARLAPASS
jgi:hypothetical protein